jgi:hypothetical protein
MGGKHARRAARRRTRLVRMIVVRITVSTAMLLGSLYAGLATGQRVVAYRQHLADGRAQRPVPACIPLCHTGSWMRRAGTTISTGRSRVCLSAIVLRDKHS